MREQLGQPEAPLLPTVDRQPDPDDELRSADERISRTMRATIASRSVGVSAPARFVAADRNCASR